MMLLPHSPREIDFCQLQPETASNRFLPFLLFRRKSRTAFAKLNIVCVWPQKNQLRFRTEKTGIRA